MDSSASSSVDARRLLMRELMQLRRCPNEHFSAHPIAGDLLRWRAVITGPESTPWEGGVFKLDLVFTEEYPAAPPRVKFVTRNVFHPNVYVDGNICLDTLKMNWCPALNVESLLMMIISLLSDPNPQSAANGGAAELYTTSRDKYEDRVRRVVEESLEQSFTDDEDDNDGGSA